MSLRQGNKIIAGHTKYHPDIFDCKWADHLLENPSWLRGDTFSWHDGSVYEAAYNHLVADLYRTVPNLYCWGNVYFCESSTPNVNDPVYSLSNNIYLPIGYVTAYSNDALSIWVYSGQPVTDAARVSANDVTNVTINIASKTETINGITISYTLAADGHKICGTSQEAAILALYNSTGVSWYYILDTTNQRFKLPRTKFGFEGLRDTVGKYIPVGLPDHSHTYSAPSGSTAGSGSASVTVLRNVYADTITNKASTSNPIYGTSTTVQEPATQMYLYFYVGEFTQSALENTAGLNAELFNAKADTNLSNVTNAVDFVIESQEPLASNDYTWYRKYKSGWVEQGGITSAGSYQTINLLVPMADSDYTVYFTDRRNATTRDGNENSQLLYPSCTSTSIYAFINSNCRGIWQVKGKAA